MPRLRPTLKCACALFLGVFALYAFTAQRGLGWCDSGEFQYRILTLGAEGVLKGCDSFATAHPLYVALCKLVCATPFHVTLVSAFFGALSVALFYLLSNRIWTTVLFALAHGLWWLSTVTEVYTMSLSLFAAELLALRRFRETGSSAALFALAALNGLHLETHNLALLALPVYVFVARVAPRRTLLVSAAIWSLAASFWLWSFFTLGPRDVLLGSYGSEVSGLCPENPLVTGLNFILIALSFSVPVANLALKRSGRPQMADRTILRALLAVHVLFAIRYFVPDQFTFFLPSVFLAYLLVAGEFPGRGRFLMFVSLQVLLPLALWGVLSTVRFPSAYREAHPGRDNASYFALPWHMTDDSAARLAVRMRSPWKGYR